MSDTQQAEIKRTMKNIRRYGDYIIRIDEVVSSDKTYYEVYTELYEGVGSEEDTYTFYSYEEAEEYFELE